MKSGGKFNKTYNHSKAIYKLKHKFFPRLPLIQKWLLYLPFLSSHNASPNPSLPILSYIVYVTESWGLFSTST